MFRAILCSPSGGQIVLVQHLVSSLSLGVCSVHRSREDVHSLWRNKAAACNTFLMKLLASHSGFTLQEPHIWHTINKESISNRNKILKNYHHNGKWSLCKFCLKPQHVSWHILNHCRMWLWFTVPFLSLVCFLFEARIINPLESHVRHFPVL